jgi:hypothetical protein
MKEEACMRAVSVDFPAKIYHFTANSTQVDAQVYEYSQYLKIKQE